MSARWSTSCGCSTCSGAKECGVPMTCCEAANLHGQPLPEPGSRRQSDLVSNRSRGSARWPGCPLGMASRYCSRLVGLSAPSSAWSKRQPPAASPLPTFPRSSPCKSDGGAYRLDSPPQGTHGGFHCGRPVWGQAPVVMGMSYAVARGPCLPRVRAWARRQECHRPRLDRIQAGSSESSSACSVKRRRGTEPPSRGLQGFLCPHSLAPLEAGRACPQCTCLLAVRGRCKRQGVFGRETRAKEWGQGNEPQPEAERFPCPPGLAQRFGLGVGGVIPSVPLVGEVGREVEAPRMELSV